MKLFVKRILEKILYNVCSKDYNELYEIIKKYEYVSFDIFDTLIKRNVKNPTDIYDIIKKRYKGNLENFKEKRINAEKIAKQKSNCEEVTLLEIYKELDYTENVKNELYNLEIEIEKEYCTVNTRMLKIYNYCLQNNKKIFLTSDMYLPKEIIENILKNNGYENYKKLYLSSDVKLTKHTGNIFKKILEEQNIQANKLVHIGDSCNGDYINPKKMGIFSILIRRQTNNTSFISKDNKSLDYSILSSFINNNIDYNIDIYSKFGYEVLGPILYSFTSFLYKKIKEDKVDKIYFLARDAKIIMEIYKEIYNEEIPVYYLKLSRRSILLATIGKINDFDDILNKYKSIIKNTSTVVDFMNILNLNINKYPKEQYFDKLIMDLTENEKNKIFSTIKSDIYETYKYQNKCLKEYLKQNNFVGKVALVDIGWNGTIQHFLNTMILENTEIYGYYYGVNKDKKYKENNEDIRNGYLFNSNQFNENQIVMYLGIGLFELMFLTTEASTIYYEKKDDLIVPVDGKPNCSKENIEIINNIQKSAMKFIKDFNASSINQDINNNNSEVWFENFRNVIINPSKKNIQLFGKIEFENFDNRKLIDNKNIFFYLLHPKRLYSDFMNSYCKTLFMKSVFIIKLPYYKILKQLYFKMKK